MRLEKIDLNLFIVFETLYRERSVTRTANVLHLTQPAVSNALNRLRKLFDDQLFVRSPEGMLPSPVADNMIGDVRKALVLFERSIIGNTQFEAHKSEKTFRLGMNDLAESLILPQLQALIAQEAPKVKLQSYYIDRQTATEELKTGSLDLLVDSPEVNAKDLKHHPLARLNYVVAIRPDHPLSQGDLALDDYLNAEHLHVSSRRRGRGQMDIALNNLGQRRNISLRTQSYLVASQITAQTDLLWTAPSAIVDPTRLNVKQAPFAIDDLMWNLYWHRSANDDPASQWMRDKISSVVKTILKSN